MFESQDNRQNTKSIFLQDENIRRLYNIGETANFNSFPERCSIKNYYFEEFSKELSKLINKLENDNTYRQETIKQLQEFISNKDSIGHTSETIIATKILLSIGEYKPVVDLLQRNIEKKIIGKEFGEIFRQLQLSGDNYKEVVYEMVDLYLDNYLNKKLDNGFDSYLLFATQIMKNSENFTTFQMKILQIAESDDPDLKSMKYTATKALFSDDYFLQDIIEFKKNYLLQDILLMDNEELENYCNIFQREYLLNGNEIPDDVRTRIEESFLTIDINDINEEHYRLLNTIERTDNKELLTNIRYSLLKQSIKDPSASAIDIDKLFSNCLRNQYEDLNLDKIYKSEAQKKEYIKTMQEACLKYLEYVCIKKKPTSFPAFFFRSIGIMKKSGLNDKEIFNVIERSINNNMLKEESLSILCDVYDKNLISKNSLEKLLKMFQSKFENELKSYIINDDQNNLFRLKLHSWNYLQTIYKEYNIPTTRDLENFFVEHLYSNNFNQEYGFALINYFADSPKFKSYINDLLKSEDENIRQSTILGICTNYHIQIKRDPTFVPDFDPKLFYEHIKSSTNLTDFQYDLAVSLLVDTGGIYKISTNKDEFTKIIFSKDGLSFEEKVKLLKKFETSLE